MFMLAHKCTSTSTSMCVVQMLLEQSVQIHGKLTGKLLSSSLYMLLVGGHVLISFSYVFVMSVTLPVPVDMYGNIFTSQACVGMVCTCLAGALHSIYVHL